MITSKTTFPSTIISDAFEAVTNGMYNPEAFAQLEQACVGTDSENEQWKNLIYAIRAFYDQDFVQMDSLLQTIDKESTAASLKRVLYHMSGLRISTEKLSYHEDKLAKRITEDSRFLKSAIDDLNESILYGEDLFIETASMLIKELKQNTPEAAERLALWSFGICVEMDFDDEALADNILMLFGQAEGLRLIALSLLESEPESALICFTRSLIKRIVDQTAGKDDAAAYLEIIEALISTCTDNDPVLLDISELLAMLETEFNLFFGFNNSTSCSKPADKIAEMKKTLAGDGLKAVIPQLSASAAETVEHNRNTSTSGTAVQLELF